MRSEIGHRERLRARFRSEGLENFDEVHVLELILFNALPRQDTKPLARRLLDYFGSLSQVLEADIPSLQKVEGVGINIATYLHMILEVARYYQVNREQSEGPLDDLNECGAYLVKYFYGVQKENVYLLCLDAKRKPICCRKLGEGSLSSIQIPTRQVVELALSSGAATVILAHNHPGGISRPSEEDLIATKRLCASLASVEVLLADHIVVADGDFVSLTQSGIYNPKDYRLMLV